MCCKEKRSDILTPAVNPALKLEKILPNCSAEGVSNSYRVKDHKTDLEIPTRPAKIWRQDRKLEPT